MATRLIRFISETQARLGWVDTTIERALFKTVREIKGVIKTPKILASLLIMLTATSPNYAVIANIDSMFEKIVGVFDQVNAINKLIKDGQQLVLEHRLKEGVQWTNNLVHSYKQLQLSQAAFKSISTAELRDSINSITINSDISLSTKDVLDSTYKADEYTPLRVRSRSNSLGQDNVNADTFNAMLNDVSEKEFDAMQVIKYSANEKDEVGKAILNGDPEKAAEEVRAKWKKILNVDSDLKSFSDLAAKASSYLKDQNKIESEELEKLITAREDMDHHSEGCLKDSAVMRASMELQHAIRKRSLELGEQEIINAKKNNETNNSSVTYMMESAKIHAQTQRIINDVQEKVSKIVKINSPAKQSEHTTNRLINNLIDTLPNESSKYYNSDEQAYAREDVRAQMKLGPSADAEISRLMTMANFAIKQQSMQLDDLREKNRLVKAMDDAGKANFDMQKNFLQSFKVSDPTLVNSALRSTGAMAKYYESIKNLDNSKKTIPKNQKSIAQSITSANATYFSNMKKHASWNLLKTIFDTYIKFVKNFFRGKKFNDVMKDENAKVKAEENARNRDMLKMYDDCAGESDV